MAPYGGGLGGNRATLGFAKDVRMERLRLAYASSVDGGGQWTGELAAWQGKDKGSLEITYGKKSSVIAGALGFGGMGCSLAKLTGLKELPYGLDRIRIASVKVAYSNTGGKTEFKFDGGALLDGIKFNVNVAIKGEDKSIAATAQGPIHLGPLLAAFGFQDKANGGKGLALSAAGFRYLTSVTESRFEVVALWDNGGRLALVLRKGAKDESYSPMVELEPGPLAWLPQAKLRWAKKPGKVDILVPSGNTEKMTFAGGFEGSATVNLSNTPVKVRQTITVALGKQGLSLTDDKGRPLLAPPAEEKKGQEDVKSSGQPEAGNLPAGKKEGSAEWTLDQRLSLGTLIEAIASGKSKDGWLRYVSDALVLEKMGVEVVAKPLAVTVFSDVTLNVGQWLSVSAKRAELTITPKSLSVEGFRDAGLRPGLGGAALSLTVEPWLKLAAAVQVDEQNRPGGSENDFVVVGMGRLEILRKIEVGALVHLGWKGKVLDEGFAFVYARGLALGSPAFKVTGLAGGFGYNRVLELPDRPQDVPDFPVVALLAGTPVNPKKGNAADAMHETLDKFKDSLKRRDQAWCVAFGMTMRIGELVELLALMVAEFRKPDFELALAGLADLEIRAKGSGTAALGHIQMAVAARYSSKAGTIKVLGALTDRSWLLDRTCRLSGGFAICVWLDGPFKGDFLVSLGGYSPLVAKKEHYPALERVGFSWNPRKGLSLTGGLYLTLDRYGLQFGVAARLHFHSDEVTVDAFFSLDATMAWAPAFFMAEMRIGARVDVRGFVTFRLTLDVGMRAWGPPFGAAVTVALSLGLMSITHTVAMGTSLGQARPSVGFTDVVKLAGGGGGRLFEIAGGMETKKALAPLRADDGRIELALTVPATSLVNGEVPIALGDKVGPLDVRPMELTGVTSKLTATVADSSGWRLTPRLGTPTEALWYVPPGSKEEREKNLLMPSGRLAVTGVTIEPPAATLPGKPVKAKLTPAMKIRILPPRSGAQGVAPVAVSDLTSAGFDLGGCV